jgi:hypothetical protein
MLSDRNYREELNDVQFNKNEAEQVIKNLPLKEDYKEYQVFEYFQTSSDKYWNYFIEAGQIEATVVYALKENNFRCWGVWQKRKNKGLVKDIFLNYYTSKGFDSIISDPVSNELDKQFWRALIEEFEKRGNKITILKKDKIEEPYNSSLFDDYWNVDKTSALGLILASEILFRIYLQ